MSKPVLKSTIAEMSFAFIPSLSRLRPSTRSTVVLPLHGSHFGFLSDGSNPVENHSIDSLGHDGAKADPSVVTALVEIPCFWYRNNVQVGPLVRFPII